MSSVELMVVDDLNRNTMADICHLIANQKNRFFVKIVVTGMEDLDFANKELEQGRTDVSVSACMAFVLNKMNVHRLNESTVVTVKAFNDLHRKAFETGAACKVNKLPRPDSCGEGSLVSSSWQLGYNSIETN